MMKQAVFLFLMSVAIAFPVTAQAQKDVMYWLQRVVTAAQKLNYSGTFVYQSGSRTETSRIAHRVDGGREVERIETLDGSPREVIRDDDEVKCFLPEDRLLIIERRSPRRAFPAVLPSGFGGLSDHYVLRKGPVGRVAGLESQAIVVEPKDEFRYGHQFWIDTQSGLLLKATLLDERGEALETFSFTEVRIGGTVAPETLVPRFGKSAAEWQVRHARANEAKSESSGWIFRTQVPGFRKVSEMKRQSVPGESEGTHMVFSDGLAAISVFIDMLPPGKASPQTGRFSLGAINVEKRIAGEHLVVVMGDAPSAALKRIADGIEPRRK